MWHLPHFSQFKPIVSNKFAKNAFILSKIEISFLVTDVKTFAKSVLQRMDNYYADEMASLLKMDNFNAYIK